MQIDNYFALVIFLGCVGLGSTQGAVNSSILCYSCNPTTPNGCANPTTTLNCSATGNWRVSCYSTYLNYNNVTGNSAANNQTGVHRSCYYYTAQNDFCSSNPGVNITRVSCTTCTTSACNNHIFNAAGEIISGGGSGGGGSGGGGSGGGRPGRNGANESVPSIIILIVGFALTYFK